MQNFNYIPNDFYLRKNTFNNNNPYSLPSNKNSKVNPNQMKRRENENILVITSKKVKEAFNLFSIEKRYLNEKKFNDALEFLFAKLPIPKINHTFLSHKLFSIFSTRENSKLFEDEFNNCIKRILSNKNVRLHISFMAMMKNPNKGKKIVELDELKEYFYESFVQGYRHLGWVINQKKEKFKNANLPVVSIQGIEVWARGFEKKIKNGFEKDLKMFDKNIEDKINFEQYCKWIYYDQNLYIKYGFEEIILATCLIVFDNVVFEP